MDNLISDILPSILKRCTKLQLLKVSENNLSGALDIDFLVSMKVIFAYSNKFFGIMPKSLTICAQLQLLDLSKNGLAGDLPQYIAFFNDLRVLRLGYNRFFGVISQWITNLTHFSSVGFIQQ